MSPHRAKVNIALVGCGFLGSRHLKTLHQLRDKVTITAVCDHHPGHAKDLAKQFHVPIVADYRELLGRAEAVSVCTPTITHAQIAGFFLANRVHAFVEKPITATLKEADTLIALAAQNDLRLQVGHVERFNAAFSAIAPLVKDPLFIECHRLNLFPNRSLDIGVVLDLMIHDIDIILGLVNSPLKEVQAVGVNVLTDKEDIANARLTFQNGCVCNITASRVSPEVTRKIRMFTRDAYFSLDYAKQEARMYTRDERGIHQKSLPIEKDEPLKRELEHFIDCVRGHRQPLVSGVEGREALRVALAINEQICKHRQHLS